MAAKTANILARVEPEVKDAAEQVMQQLGIPASVVINMLYKQIIMTNSIPFSLSIPLKKPSDKKTGHHENYGMDEVMDENSRPLAEVFADLYKDMDDR